MNSPHLIPDIAERTKLAIKNPGLFSRGSETAEIPAVPEWHGVVSAVSEAERHRLVKAAKSRTREKEAKNHLESLGLDQYPALIQAASEQLEQNRQDCRKYFSDHAGIKVPEYVNELAIESLIERKSEYTPSDAGKLLQEPCPEYNPQNLKRIEGHGRKTIIQHREWSEEYRVRTQVETTAGTLPPEHSGPRFSEELSIAGARKISDSCFFMAKEKGGYSTFITGTLDEQARHDINRLIPVVDRSEAGFSHTLTRGAKWTPVRFEDGAYTPIKWEYKTSIQKEISRSLNSLNKIYQRGFTYSRYIRDGKTQKTEAGNLFTPLKCETITVPGSSRLLPDGDTTKKTKEDGAEFCPLRLQSLPYCWVVENPKNEDGEDNPHCHMMIQWRVDYRHFKPWARRLESVWNNGYFHIEKIKEPEKAGAYMAKAAGYMTKGKGAKSQGEVRGNRYGISKESRAPDWMTIEEGELGIMGSLINDVYDYMTLRHGTKFQNRRKLNDKLQELPKGDKRRKAVGTILEKVRAEINELPAISSKYQIVLKGKQAYHQFIGWAKSKLPTKENNWLPAKEAGEHWENDKRPESHWLHEVKRRLFDRKANRFHKSIIQDMGYWFSVRHSPEAEGFMPLDEWGNLREGYV